LNVMVIPDSQTIERCRHSLEVSNLLILTPPLKFFSRIVNLA
jgi:hypothetical protein